MQAKQFALQFQNIRNKITLQILTFHSVFDSISIARTRNIHSNLRIDTVRSRGGNEELLLIRVHKLNTY